MLAIYGYLNKKILFNKFDKTVNPEALDQKTLSFPVSNLLPAKLEIYPNQIPKNFPITSLNRLNCCRHNEYMAPLPPTS